MKIIVLLIALLIPLIRLSAQAVALPGYTKVYDFTPTAVAQLVAGHASANGATISYHDPPNILGTDSDLSIASIVSHAGQTALQVAPTDTIGLVLCTFDADGSGFNASPPFYAECEEYFPDSTNDWAQHFFTFAYYYTQSASVNDWYEFDCPEAWGNLACGGMTRAQSACWNHSGAISVTPGMQTRKEVPLPSSGTWHGAWHTFSIWMTPAGDPANPGSMTYYADGQEYFKIMAPTDTYSVSRWNRPQYFLWSSNSGIETKEQSFNCAASGSLTGWLGYLRVWVTNATPTPTPTPQVTPTPTPQATHGKHRHHHRHWWGWWDEEADDP
jgi:hypothetical protein